MGELGKMKYCNGCGLEKPESDFPRRAYPSGRIATYHRCKPCTAVYRAANRAAISAAKQRWAVAHPARAAEIKQQYFERNRPRVLARTAAWKRAHPESRDGDNLKRRMAGRRQKPRWADDFLIRQFYDCARERTKCTGIAWHVDHIYPLYGKTVSGLHTHENLQVITGALNVRKGNRLTI